MKSVTVLQHPLAGNCLRTLRNRDTRVEEFRQAMYKLGVLLAVETTKDLRTEMDTVITPLDVEAKCPYVVDSRILLVPILRAGLGFLDSFLDVLPGARVAHIGISRDHVTLEARPYLDSVPGQPSDFDRVFVLDPMLATGNSSTKALEIIVNKGYAPGQIKLICAVAVKQGINQVHGKFPEVGIVTAVIDPKLNEKAYIVPGLGDAGDRLYLF
ncbi:MAG TPA: uracil phosphoribosyltransferase [Syntrophomonadaceae bacterium]|nr:uracil phosphoribosyltransferase [Syntrophomonadaceae bacterium]